jgi:hypothetical protein
VKGDISSETVMIEAMFHVAHKIEKHICRAVMVGHQREWWFIHPWA